MSYDAKMLNELVLALEKKLPGRRAAGLTTVLAKLRDEDCKPLAAGFHQMKNKHLVNVLKKKLASDFETVCVALVTDPTTYDAELLYNAFHGLGTNEDIAIEVLCTRTDQELNAIKVRYGELYMQKHPRKPTLKHWIHTEFSGNLRTLLEGMVAPGGRQTSGDADTLQAELHAAGDAKFGTDRKKFVAIFSTYTREVLCQIDEAYYKAHGKRLAEIIKKENFSGNMRKALLALIMPLPVYFAERLVTALGGLNTDEAGVIRLIRSRKQIDLPQINVELAKLKRNQNLDQWLSRRTGAKLKPMLRGVVANFGN